MAIINKGTAFSNGEQLSASKLNSLVDAATFGTDSVDNASTIVNANGAITVRDSGVTAAKLATGSVTTNKIVDANVTFAKLTDVIDDDTMDTATNTTLATSESIKAYVDEGGGFTPSTYNGEESVTLPNGLIMKFGSKSVSGDSTGSVSFATAFPGGIVQVQLTIETDIPLNNDAGLSATSQTVSGFTIQNGAAGTETISWMAIGYK